MYGNSLGRCLEPRLILSHSSTSFPGGTRWVRLTGPLQRWRGLVLLSTCAPKDLSYGERFSQAAVDTEPVA
jgi:hypothetical protein